MARQVTSTLPEAGWSSQRLQAAVGACGVAAMPAREGACEGLNPHRDRLGTGQPGNSPEFASEAALDDRGWPRRRLHSPL